MPTTPATIRSLLERALPDAIVEVRDTTGTGDHFAAEVVSSTFEGQTPVDRHRMVYAALGDLLRADIHALALITETPSEKAK